MTAPPDKLSRREREIMNVLFALGERASAEAIRAGLSDPPSYSAVRAMLVKLEAKGFIKHREEGLRYVYSPTTPRTTARRAALQQLVRVFFGGSPGEAATALLKNEHWTDGELDTLTAEIERVRKERGETVIGDLSNLSTFGTLSTFGSLAVAISASPALLVVIKATLAILAGLLAARWAGRARASIRHVILASVFAAILALPLAALLLPAVAIGVPVARSIAPPAPLPAAAARSESAAPAATINPAAERPTAMSAGAVVAVVWAAGALLFSLSFGVAIWRLHVIRRRALPWLEARALTDRLAMQAGIRKPIEILLHEDVAAPLTCGFTRPAIILPDDAREWSEEAIRRALVHELEHVRRRDWWTHLTARALCAGYWFHPLVWIAYRQLSLEAERACDDAVVEREEGTLYAEQLVSLARRMASADAQPTLAMANRSDLARRVSAVLDSDQSRGRAGLARAALVVGLTAALVLTLAPMRAIGAVGEEQRQQRTRVAAIDRALVETASEGSLEDVKHLLDRGARVNATVDGDGTALIVAAREGHTELVTFLLERGADPNIGVEGDGTALIMAAREGHLRIVELLLNRGADVEQVVPGDENALIQGSGGNGRDTLAVVQLLVARGANVNARVWADGGYQNQPGEWRTPLSMAKKRGRRDVIDFLVSKGATE